LVAATKLELDDAAMRELDTASAWGERRP
jgi:hypothetical protein